MNDTAGVQLDLTQTIINVKWTSPENFALLCTSTATIAGTQPERFILISKDGERWEQRNAPDEIDNVTALAYADGLWLCGGYTFTDVPHAIICKSSNLNLETWTQIHDVPGAYIVALAAGKIKGTSDDDPDRAVYVALVEYADEPPAPDKTVPNYQSPGDSFGILSSIDGKASVWKESLNIGRDHVFNGVTFCKDAFYACAGARQLAENNQFLTTVQIEQHDDEDYLNQWVSVTYALPPPSPPNPGPQDAVPGGRIYRSQDGLDWNVVYSNDDFKSEKGQLGTWYEAEFRGDAGPPPYQFPPHYRLNDFNGTIDVSGHSYDFDGRYLTRTAFDRDSSAYDAAGSQVYSVAYDKESKTYAAMAALPDTAENNILVAPLFLASDDGISWQSKSPFDKNSIASPVATPCIAGGNGLFVASASQRGNDFYGVFGDGQELASRDIEWGWDAFASEFGGGWNKTSTLFDDFAQTGPTLYSASAKKFVMVGTKSIGSQLTTQDSGGSLGHGVMTVLISNDGTSWVESYTLDYFNAVSGTIGNISRPAGDEGP